MAGDAWQELSGYDGRLAATCRAIFRPGFLTLEYLQGRRVRYLSPMRLYLTVSVIYFLIAAGAPNIGGGLRIGFTNNGSSAPQVLTESERRDMLNQLGDVPWMLRPMVQQIAEDPDGFRARVFATLPRVFFAMLPAFAAMVALFYRGRNFPTALVFTVHVHAFAFVIFSVSEAAKFTHSEIAATALGLIAALVFTWYVPKALITVYGCSWWATIWKTTAMGFIYLLLSIPAFFAVLILSTLV